MKRLALLTLLALASLPMFGCLYETQTWWSPMAGAPNPDEPGHLHTSVDLPPVGSTISEPLKREFKVQLHNNPSHLNFVRWSENSTVKQKVAQDFTCETEHCELMVAMTINPERFDHSGYRELRVTAETTTRTATGCATPPGGATSSTTTSPGRTIAVGRGRRGSAPPAGTRACRT
jgi:hypothetical protein